MKTNHFFFSFFLVLVSSFFVLSCNTNEDLTGNSPDTAQEKKNKLLEIVKKYDLEDAFILPEDPQFFEQVDLAEFEKKAREFAPINQEARKNKEKADKQLPIVFEFLEKLKAAKSQAEADSLKEAYKDRITFKDVTGSN